MVSSLATNEVPLDPVALGDEIARTAAHLDAATHRLLSCIRAFDACMEWERQGALSCAHWLAWRIGLDPGTAREKVRVARALGQLPLLDDGLRRGELSYAKVRALSRVATAENEVQLAELARSCTGAQLEQLCRRLRRVVDPTAEGDRLDDQRYLKREHLESGMVRLSAVLHPDEAALVMKAIEQARIGSTRAGDSADVSGETPPPVIPMADALVKLAEAYLAHASSPADGTHPRNQLFIHLDQDPLAGDGTLAATLDDGTRLSAETLRRLGCDCSVVPVRHGKGAGEDAGGGTGDRAGEDAGSLGRRTRTVAPALRLALWRRDRGCRFPGCTNHLFVHAHHIQHWAHGGPTTAENLALLCSAHHRLVHEGGFTLKRLSNGELTFADRRGRVIDPAPRPAALEGEALALLEHLHTEAGLEIDANPGLSEWEGDALDYEWALDALIKAGYTPTDSAGFPRVVTSKTFSDVRCAVG